MMKKWSIFQFSHPIESHSSVKEGQIEVKGKRNKIKKKELKGETTKKWQEHLPSSTHIRPSSMSFNPVGHAHDILGLFSFIWGAGKHK